MEGCCFISEIQVYDFFDWTSKIAEVFDVLAILDDSALTAQDASKGCLVWIKCHCDFLDHATLLVAEKNNLIALLHLRKEHTQSGSLHDLETDSKLVLAVSQRATDVENECFH